jgi:Flp pilus assembly protein CpaB
MDVLVRPPARLPLRRVLKRPVPWWAGAAALALFAGLLTARMASAAVAQQSSWGAAEAVVVLRHDVAAGELVDAGDLELRQLPRLAVPSGALRAVRAGVAVVDLHRGEALTRERLAGASTSALAARLPAGTRGVAIPLDETSVPVRRGDRVDVIVTVDPESAGQGPPSFVVARNVPVVGVTDEAATVAVPLDLAPKVAWATTTAAVTLSLVSGTR